MKILIISDTHLKKDLSKLKDFLEVNLSEVDLIIHAGDYTDENVVTLLKETNKFIGVYGNNDNENIRKILKEKEIIQIEEFKIGTFHGHGEKGTTAERAYKAFENDRVDVIVFGHSHQPELFTKKGVLMINPGSITSKRKEKMYSYAILEISKNTINVNLSFLDKQNILF